MIRINKSAFRNSVTGEISFHVYEIDDDSVTQFLKMSSQWDVQFLHSEKEMLTEELAREFGLAPGSFLIWEPQLQTA